MMKIIILLLIVFAILAETHAQSRYTKGAENGYGWIAMDIPQLPNENNKFNYLSGILDRTKLMKNNFTDHKKLFCNEEINFLLEENKSKSFTLEDVIQEIDQFYTEKENLIIPIVFAYCYVIKKEAGLLKDELNDYKKLVLKYCEE